MYLPFSPSFFSPSVICSPYALYERYTDAMTSYLSRLSPVPGFPEYTGPHKVGTIDIEFPVSELDSPSPAPDDTLSTIQYRVFYPCEPEAKGKKLHWVPSPQREYLSAYARFLGAGSTLAEVIS